MPLTWTVNLHKQTAVELTSLTAQFENDVIHLTWDIGAAHDVIGFQIERSSDKNREPEDRAPEFIPLNTASRTYDFEDRHILRGLTYTYTLFAVGASGAHKIGSVDINVPLPNKMVLAQNYPNPFNPTTTIRYILPKDQFIELVLYDVTGKQVRLLEKGRREAGEYSIVWDGLDDEQVRVSTGVYVYRLSTESETLTKKLTLLK